jgi:hypothetical protein
VTTISGDDVCNLDSESTGCSEENNLATVDCRCYPGVVSEDCEGRHEWGSGSTLQEMFVKITK